MMSVFTGLSTMRKTATENAIKPSVSQFLFFSNCRAWVFSPRTFSELVKNEIEVNVHPTTDVIAADHITNPKNR